MSTSTTTTSPSHAATEGTSDPPAGRSTGALATKPDSTSVLVTDQGKTTIAQTVVEKIAGTAAREVSGVYKLGGGTARAIGALREKIPGQKTSLSQGVAVEVGERQAAVDLDIVVDYGVAIADLAAAVRANVISSLESMTGLEVTEINIAVGDIHFDDDEDSDDSDDSQETRVQ